MKSELKGLARSFLYAYQGVRHCVLRERNFRIHLAAACYALFLAFRLGLDGLELAVLILTISLVLVMELLNTAVEALVNQFSPEYHPWAKVAKDTAAGAVLVCAAVSVAVGFCLLWRPDALLDLALRVLASPGAFLLLALSAAAAAWFVFGVGARGKEHD